MLGAEWFLIFVRRFNQAGSLLMGEGHDGMCGRLATTAP